MADIEKKDVELGAWWWTAEKIDYSKILWSKKQEIWGQETAKEQEQAADILKQIEWNKSTEAEKNIAKKDITLTPEIKSAISQLNRPEAKKGIEESYASIDTTIKNSKNEKGIAGVLGKIMNRINP